MRTDPTQDDEFYNAKEWEGADFGIRLFEPAEATDGEGPPFRATPFSGNERNRLFIQRDSNFEDLTLVSGIDFREDGRGFVIFDYDHDGWVDLGIVSPNYPRFRIVKNRIGERRQQNSFVQIELIGGQTAAEASQEWSPRDPFGATVLVTTGETKRKFQLSCGEGLSSQNAKRIHVGMGESTKIDKLEVTWPSGRKSVRENVDAGKRIKIFENENASSKAEADAQ
ncbi:MAG: ASPIC/UnbV domain-containing protein [Pirellulaceae bacterium]|nr:ASPIC/UnbV domain-containing protein [Pirellulaceae bacterium]